VARGGIASARLRDGRIVVFGGERLEPGGTTISEVEMFDPRRRRWTSLPDLRTPRHGLGGVALGRRVYAIQGGPTPGFDFSNAIEYLDVPRR
jgi:Kelch motif